MKQKGGDAITDVRKEGKDEWGLRNRKKEFMKTRKVGN